MALIYSRPKLRLPRIRMTGYYQKGKPKKIKFKRIVGILGIFLLIIIIMLKDVLPIFNSMCLEKAKSIATLISNEETKKVIKNYQYSDFMVVHKDEKGNILMLEANMTNINQAISDIATNMQIEIDKVEQEDIRINLGSLTGIHLLLGRGFKIPIRVITAGNVKTNVKSELINKGINQTLHRLYLEIECEISILTPFNTLQESILNQVILAENVIVGNIPTSYYNIDGINENQALELLQ